MSFSGLVLPRLRTAPIFSQTVECKAKKKMTGRKLGKIGPARSLRAPEKKRATRGRRLKFRLIHYLLEKGSISSFQTSHTLSHAGPDSRILVVELENVV